MLKGGVDSANGPGTTVGVNVALSGTLKDQNDITIYGMVDGEIISDQAVTVGETAQVKGPIRGNVVTVAGVARGSIDAGEKLEILSTGKVYGSITTKDLVIHSGAILVGKSSMAGQEEVDEEGQPTGQPAGRSREIPVEEKEEVPVTVGQSVEESDEEDEEITLPQPDDE